MLKTAAYAAQSATSPLAPFSINRRDPGPRDVQMEILFCGVCHTDIHFTKNEWGFTTFPCVPGHEIIGRVTKVGAQVKGFKPGDMAGVGCLVDSCRDCRGCRDGLENYCENGSVFTYNAPDKHGAGPITYGGYSTAITVDEAFTLKISNKLNPAAAAPLLCAGITTYSPLRTWKVGPGQRIGVVGLGGLGHMALKIAHAMGAKVVLFTTSPGKIEDGKRLGADEVVISKDADQMAKQANSLDFILNTLAVPHDLNAYMNMLRRDGTMCLVGAPDRPHPSVEVMPLLFKRRRLVGSLIGGLRETQEMLDFCAQHNIVSDIEVIPMQKINEAYGRMLKSDVKYRFVIDLASLKG